jgi:large subunit ribosomal protein L17
MFRNMACSLIRSVRVDKADKAKPGVPGRIVTTTAKAKELRPFVEKLVTMARKAIKHADEAERFETSAERDSAEWKNWRESEEWNKWNQAIAPAVAMRRRAFAVLRDNEAVDILFDELAQRFVDRDGGYTRVIQLANVRLGDGGKQSLIEFVGERDRVKPKRRAPLVTDVDEDLPQPVAAPTVSAAPAESYDEPSAQAEQQEGDGGEPAADKTE